MPYSSPTRCFSGVGSRSRQMKLKPFDSDWADGLRWHWSFEVAADILRTAIAPSWTEIGKLAAIVGLRTALNYFLQQEIDREAKQHPGRKLNEPQEQQARHPEGAPRPNKCLRNSSRPSRSPPSKSTRLSARGSGRRTKTQVPSAPHIVGAVDDFSGIIRKIPSGKAMRIS
jgi:hypothetical protein